MKFIIATVLFLALSSPCLAASATATASSSSSGGVTIAGTITGGGTVHASATVTRNGVTVHREHTQVGPGSFNDHAD